MLAPGALQAEDLGQAGPVQGSGKVGGGDQLAHLLLLPVAAVPRGRRAPIYQGGRPQGGGRVEEQREVRDTQGVPGGLVLPDQQQVIPARRQHLGARLPLAEERIAGATVSSASPFSSPRSNSTLLAGWSLYPRRLSSPEERVPATPPPAATRA